MLMNKSPYCRHCIVGTYSSGIKSTQKALKWPTGDYWKTVRNNRQRQTKDRQKEIEKRKKKERNRTWPYLKLIVCRYSMTKRLHLNVFIKTAWKKSHDLTWQNHMIYTSKKFYFENWCTGPKYTGFYGQFNMGVKIDLLMRLL